MPHDVAPDIPLRYTTWEAIAAYERLKREATHQRDKAVNADDRLEAQLWIDNADRNLARCRRQLAKDSR